MSDERDETDIAREQDRDRREELARRRRQAEDRPAHPRELDGPLEAEDSAETRPGKI